MSLKDKEKWNNKFAGAEYITGEEPVAWFKENAELLPGRGKGLDIASGEGRNAVYAATLGYDMLAIDISETGLEKAQALAEKNQTRIRTQVVDLDDYCIETSAYDLILCFQFLNRQLFPQILQGLKPGGWLIYETFNRDYLKYSNFREEWTLDYNELLRQFSDLRVMRYRELDKDEKGLSSIVAWAEVGNAHRKF
jgi:SAM-dependent methyltransferase